MNDLANTKHRLPQPLFRYDESGALAFVGTTEALVHLSANDIDVARAFLTRYRADPKTFITYAKEIERFLLWCEYAGCVGLKTIDEPHIVAYRQFLSVPKPIALWCTKKHAVTGKRPRLPRFKPDGEPNPAWRPFAATLANTTVRKALVVVDQFFKHLAYARYVERHPLPPKRRVYNTRAFAHTAKQRYLDRNLIDVAQKTLTVQFGKARDQLPFLRARYTLLLFFHTGMRISETACNDMSAFVHRNKEWHFDIAGSSGKRRSMPVTRELLDALGEYRHHIGLPRWPDPADRTPLIPDRNVRHRLGTRRIDQILQKVFHAAADEISEQDPRGAELLRGASAHWLRHSYGQHLARDGVAIQHIQEHLGHSSLHATVAYIENNKVPSAPLPRTASVKPIKPQGRRQR